LEEFEYDLLGKHAFEFLDDSLGFQKFQNILNLDDGCLSSASPTIFVLASLANCHIFMKLLKAVLIISIQTSIMLFLANLLFFPAMAFAFQGFMTSKQGASSVKSLDILVRDLDNRSFDVTLFIENKNTTPLCLQGIKMELQQTVPKATTNSVPMPGFNGPRKSSTSSGTHLLNIRNPGHLIDLAGRQKAKWNLQNAVWEIVWNQDDPCGKK
jgi:hypothetical protein